jgi:plastocyanin
MPRSLLAIAALLLAIAAASASPVPARAAQHTVDITDGAFTPAVITIRAGDTITWTNSDDSPHTVTSDDGAFDSGLIDEGQSWSMTFTRAGTFGYRCDFHSEMRGTVVVREAGTSQPQADPQRNALPPAAATSTDHAGHAAGAGDQPDTALSAPLPLGPGWLSPALLMGLGLLVIAASIFRRPGRLIAPEARPMGGWRR